MAYQRDHLEQKEKYISFKTPSDYLKSQEGENLQMTILVVKVQGDKKSSFQIRKNKNYVPFYFNVALSLPTEYLLL